MNKHDDLRFLLTQAPSPCFVIDKRRLLDNVQVLGDLQKRSGARILLALKCFSAWDCFPLLSRQKNGPLWGVCASSVDEARLGREKFGGEVHAFAAAWNEAEILELLELADHIIFNSLAQWRRFQPLISGAKRHIKCGLRLNPEHSEGATAIYNPCHPGSRLGIRQKELAQFSPRDFKGISGLHWHTLCEQGADALERTLECVEEKFAKHLPQCQWLNFGGGHHITKANYDRELLIRLAREWHDKYQAQIYIEPGEAVALDAGWLVATVLDLVEADMPVAILDISAACHMPDVLEMPYRPNLYYMNEQEATMAQAKGEAPFNYRLAGKSCLAGDVIGEYSFRSKLSPGQKLIFADMAIYSMVKTTTFNGLRLPSIAMLENMGPNLHLRMIRSFGYADFLNRLS